MSMVIEQAYSTKFIAIKAKDSKVSIYCRVILDRKKTEFSVGVVGEKSDWDEASGKFIETIPHNKYLNSKLSLAEGKIYGCYISILGKGIHPDVSRIKKEFKGAKAYDGATPMVMDYLASHIVTISAKTNEYTQGTINHYYTLQEKLGAFLKQNKIEKLRLHELRRQHIVQFQDYLLTTKQGEGLPPIGRSTSNNYLKKLKAMVNTAISNEILDRDPFFGFKLQGTKSKTKYLTNAEIESIENNDLGGNMSLHKVKLIFLFTVYTGLRYSDALKLRKADIKKESDGLYWMAVTQKKTDEFMQRPLLEEAKQLFERLLVEYPDSEYVLPRSSNKNLNDLLKVIATICRIDKIITLHSGRHTFATTILHGKGLDIKTISWFMGHQKVQTTEGYLTVTEEYASSVVKSLSKKEA